MVFFLPELLTTRSPDFANDIQTLLQQDGNQDSNRKFIVSMLARLLHYFFGDFKLPMSDNIHYGNLTKQKNPVFGHFQPFSGFFMFGK
jgi:hypothetical protein